MQIRVLEPSFEDPSHYLEPECCVSQSQNFIGILTPSYTIIRPEIVGILRSKLGPQSLDFYRRILTFKLRSLNQSSERDFQSQLKLKREYSCGKKSGILYIFSMSLKYERIFYACFRVEVKFDRNRADSTLADNFPQFFL